MSSALLFRTEFFILNALMYGFDSKTGKKTKSIKQTKEKNIYIGKR